LWPVDTSTWTVRGQRFSLPPPV